MGFKSDVLVLLPAFFAPYRLYMEGTSL